MNTINFFEDLIGQEKVQNRLNFLVNGYKNSGVTQNTLFIAGRGVGKTFGANLLARALNHVSLEKGVKKPLIEVNAPQIKTTEQFIEAVLIPHQNQSYSCFLDELQGANHDIQNLLLSVLAPNKENRNKIQHEGTEVIVDFCRHTFIMATTEPQQILLPLLDRTTIVNLGEYNEEALAHILQKNLDKKINHNVALELATFCRGNARSAVLMAREVNNYRFAVKGTFTSEDIKALMIILDIFPQGISRIELTTLEKLSECAEQSLQMLCAKTGLTKASQQDVEKRLLALGFMDIKGKRSITVKGRQYLENLKNW